MKKTIMADINEGLNIIFDRYVPSNIAHQAVKFPENQRKTFADWVKRLEYNILEMPSPDVIIFLDVDPVIAGRMVALKGKRSYTDAEKDIHEANDSYMHKVYQMYKQMAQDEDWVIIQATDGENMLSEEKIAKDIIIALAQKGFPIEDPKKLF